MKSILVIASLFAATLSQAGVLPHFRVGTMTPEYIDQGQFPQFAVTEAKLSINEARQTVRLTVRGYPMVQLQAQGDQPLTGVDVSTERVIDLPIIEQRVTRCGTVTIAERDQRPVDGILKRIEIRESRVTGARCTSRRQVGLFTHIYYHTEGYNRTDATEFNRTSIFTGPELQDIRPLRHITQ